MKIKSILGLAAATLILSSCVTNKKYAQLQESYQSTLKSASNLNGNLNCSKELEHYAS